MNTSAISTIPTDERQFKQLFETHYAEMVGFAIKYLRDQEDAEEIVQEVFANLWHKASQISIQSSLRSYLFGSVRNACLNQKKHEKVVRAYEEHHRIHMPMSHTEDQVEYDELSERLKQAMEEIPPKCREIFEMNRFEGKRYKEIAEKLNISLKTVENQMGKALKILRSELEDYLVTILLVLAYGGFF